MMKKHIVIFGLFINAALLNSQWLSNYWGNNQGDDPILNSVGMAVASDVSGNSYVTGYTYNNSTNNDIVLIKYNALGDTAFTRIYNGNANGEDKAFGIVVDEDGYIYITGQTEVIGKGLQLVLLKYSPTGNLEWDITYSATSSDKDDVGKAITIDHNDNVYVTGFVTKSDNHKDIVTIKYRPDGTSAWVKTEDGDGGWDSEGLGIVVDGDGFVYVTGYTTSVNSATNTDIITLKYSPNGSLKWDKTYNGQNNEEDKAFGITLDDGDNIYVTGYTTIDTVTLNTSAVTIKYRSNGVQKWTRTFESGLPGSLDKAWGIAVDDDKVYITGQAASVNNDLNYFTSKYSESGNELWTRYYDGPGHGADYANAITILHNGKVAVTGASWGTDNNFDYATIVMNKNNGNQYNSFRYGMNPNSNDIAQDISSSDNRIFVTGYSEQLQYSPGGGACAISTLQYLGGDNEDNATANVPGSFKLYQNYPNPFNPSTTINFDITNRSSVKLVVYDMLGKVADIIVDQELEAGSYSITYKNNKLSSGIYFYQLTAGSYTDVKKMSLIK